MSFCSFSNQQANHRGSLLCNRFPALALITHYCHQHAIYASGNCAVAYNYELLSFNADDYYRARNVIVLALLRFLLSSSKILNAVHFMQSVQCHDHNVFGHH